MYWQNSDHFCLKKLLDDNYFNFNDMIGCIRLVPETLLYVRKFLIKSEEFRTKFIELIEPEWYDYLPYEIANNPVVMKKCNRTAKEQLDDRFGYIEREWFDENGKIKAFFHLKGNFPIRSINDYYRIYREYIDSKLSVRSFCERYGIDSESGFLDLLDKIKKGSYVASSEIDDVKYIAQRNFYNLSRATAIKLANGELTFEDFFNTAGINFKSSNINIYYNALSSEDKNKFSLNLMKYFEAHTPLFPEKFIVFLTTTKHNALDNYKYFVKGNLVAPKDLDNYKLFVSQFQKLKNQFFNYYRKNMYCTYGIGDNTYEVNDDVIDQAYAYAQDMQLHISNYSMSYLCKEIAMGRLEYSKETKEQKDELIDLILKLVYEEKTIEEYISTMKNQAQKK